MGPETSKPPKKDQPIPDKNLPFSLSDYVELQTKIKRDIWKGDFGSAERRWITLRNEANSEGHCN
jgi:hypothetical protein